jgi:putative transposase
MINAITTLGPEVGTVAACAALGLARATFYRQLHPVHGPMPRKASPRALTADEKQAVLDVLHEPRFADLAPAEVYATLLDEGRYLCSERTMYRVLAENREVRERRNQLRHPKYEAPQLLATKPKQLWSWDITKLLGPAKWDLLLPVRDTRRVQPLRRGLDGRRRRVRRACRAADP